MIGTCCILSFSYKYIKIWGINYSFYITYYILKWNNCILFYEYEQKLYFNFYSQNNIFKKPLKDLTSYTLYILQCHLIGLKRKTYRRLTTPPRINYCRGVVFVLKWRKNSNEFLWKCVITYQVNHRVNTVLPEGRGTW